jgi:hypothetical protein
MSGSRSVRCRLEERRFGIQIIERAVMTCVPSSRWEHSTGRDVPARAWRLIYPTSLYEDAGQVDIFSGDKLPPGSNNHISPDDFDERGGWNDV